MPHLLFRRYRNNKGIKMILTKEINGKKFTFHKYTPLSGRKIVACYPLTAISSAMREGEDVLTSYNRNESILMELMKFVSAHESDGTEVRLVTEALINDRCGDWETLIKVEFESLKHNCPFLGDETFKGFGASIMAQFEQKMASALEKALIRIAGEHDINGEVDGEKEEY
jgi:hypothetical protein